MAIYGIAGKPGSGKTFWAVSHLLSKYFEFNRIHEEFFKRTPVEIVSNIEDLRLDHYRLDEMIEKAGGKEKFFTVEYQRELLKRMTKIVYIIDEAGQYFGTKFSDEKVIFFFQYHRHLGIDFYLIAPGVSSICPLIVRLMEYRLQAKPRSKRVLSSFRYEKVVEGDMAGSVVLKRDQRVFRLYKSMDREETEKIGSVVHRYLVMTGVMVIVALIGFYSFISMMRGKMDRKVGKKNIAVAEASNVVKDKPPVKSDLEKPCEDCPGGIPLAERDLKGGTRPVVEREHVDFETLARDYTRVRVFRNGEDVVIYSDDRFIPKEQLALLMSSGVRVGDGFYVKKKRVLEEERRAGFEEEKEKRGQAKKGAERGQGTPAPAEYRKKEKLRVGRRG